MFCTAAIKPEAQYPASELDVDENSIALNYSADECFSIARWLRKSGLAGSVVILNADD